MRKSLLSIEDVKKILKVTDFNFLSKDTIDKFVILMPNIDKKIAIKIIEQYPSFAKLSESIVDNLIKLYNNALEQNNKSNEMSMQSYKQILDELRQLIRKENLSSEERKYITEKMIEVADKIAELDSKNKAFIEKILGFGSKVIFGILILSAAILFSSGNGGETNGESNKVEEYEAEDEEIEID